MRLMLGIKMLETILLESEMHDDYALERNGAFIRSHYIQSLNCLLHGLPEDLRPQELEALRAALPEGCSYSAVYSHNARKTGAYKPFFAASSQQGHYMQNERSFIRRLISLLVILCFLLLQVLIPYLKCFVHFLYRLELEHHLSEQVLAMSVSTTNAIWRFGADTVGAISRNASERVGHLALATVLWCSREVTAGVEEGVGRGLELMHTKEGSKDEYCCALGSESKVPRHEHNTQANH